MALLVCIHRNGIPNHPPASTFLSPHLRKALMQLTAGAAVSTPFGRGLFYDYCPKSSLAPQLMVAVDLPWGKVYCKAGQVDLIPLSSMPLVPQVDLTPLTSMPLVQAQPSTWSPPYELVPGPFDKLLCATCFPDKAEKNFVNYYSMRPTPHPKYKPFRPRSGPKLLPFTPARSKHYLGLHARPLPAASAKRNTNSPHTSLWLRNWDQSELPKVKNKVGTPPHSREAYSLCSILMFR